MAQTPPYCFELNEHDVLCGRGSGPNDRVGNIEFRNLVLSRKSEYLAAPSRDAKGRIASSIVDAIRARGGRFLRKLSAAQAKNAGFKRDIAVYEMADEGTVLEKAKQTLRQNRAEFVKEQNANGGMHPQVAAVSVGVGGVSDYSINNGGGGYSNNDFASASFGCGVTPQTPLSQNSYNAGGVGQINGTISAAAENILEFNPIPLDTGSMEPGTNNQGNNFGMNGNSTNMTRSNNVAGLGGNNNFNNSNSNHLNSQNSGVNEYSSQEEHELMKQFEQLKKQQEILFQQQQSLMTNTNNGMQQTQQNNNFRFQQVQNEMNQNQMGGHNQMAAGQNQILNQTFQNQMGGQNQMNDQQYQQQPQHQQQQPQDNANPTDLFSQLLRQYNINPEDLLNPPQQQQQEAPQNQDILDHYQPQQQAQNQYQQAQHQYQPQQVQSQQQYATNHPTPPPAAAAASAKLLPFMRRLSVEDQQHILQQYKQLQSQHMSFAQPAPTPQLQQPQGTNVPQRDVPQQRSLKSLLQRNDSQQNANWDNDDSEQKDYVDMSQPLNDAPQNIKPFTSTIRDSEQTLPTTNRSTTKEAQPIKNAQHAMQLLGQYVDSSEPLKGYVDSSKPLKGYNPAKQDSAASGDDATIGSGEAETGDSFDYKFDPTRRRAPSTARQRRTMGRDNRSNIKSSENSANTLRLSGVEPANLEEESLRLSYLTAEQLQKTLDEGGGSSTNMSFTSLGASCQSWAMEASDVASSSTGQSFKSQLDHSMISLMSMSLSEIQSEGLQQNNLKSDTANDNDKKDKPLEIAVEKKDIGEDSRFKESEMSLGASLDNWDKEDWGRCWWVKFVCGSE